MNKIFKGLYTALLTPFKNGRIDFFSLENIIECQISNNVDGIIIAGSTGEGASLTKYEYISLLQATSDIIKTRTQLIAGCSASSTDSAITQVLEAQKISIDGLMVTTPHYVRPTQTGLFEHFNSIHEIAEVPIMLYSVPVRTGVDFTDDTIIKLSELPRIVGLKDAGKDIERPLRLSIKVKNDFSLLSGDDESSLAFNAQGGVGCVSVISNIQPKMCKELQDQWTRGNFKSALKIHQKLLPLYKAIFNEPNPIGIKYAAEYLDMCSSELRLPLTEATFDTREKIELALKMVGK